MLERMRLHYLGWQYYGSRSWAFQPAPTCLRARLILWPNRLAQRGSVRIIKCRRYSCEDHLYSTVYAQVRRRRREPRRASALVFTGSVGRSMGKYKEMLNVNPERIIKCRRYSCEDHLYSTVYAQVRRRRREPRRASALVFTGSVGRSMGKYKEMLNVNPDQTLAPFQDRPPLGDTQEKQRLQDNAVMLDVIFRWVWWKMSKNFKFRLNQ